MTEDLIVDEEFEVFAFLVGISSDDEMARLSSEAGGDLRFEPEVEPATGGCGEEDFGFERLESEDMDTA